jgi:methionyl-tRNA formyltransferase
MNIALFASDRVGYEIAQFLAVQEEPIVCLVLDSNDRKGYSELIRKAFADRYPVFYSDQLSQTETLDRLHDFDLDLIILAWWPYLIKNPLISIPRLGCLNFHPSYLPYCRGKDPNFWAIVEGAPFGVTLHFIDLGIDTGDIAFQSLIPVMQEDTGQTLYEKALKAIVELFKANYPYIRMGDIPRIAQDPTQGNFHRRKELTKASEIILTQEYRAEDLLNILRARTFPPHAGAWFSHNNEKYEVRIEITKVQDEYGS